jgi:RNA polymerase sigma-70 factor (ECF subfamily)
MKPLINGNITDSQLTQAVKYGNQLAFKELFYKYHPKLFRYAVVHVRSRETASDLVEEVFFRLWYKREKLNPQKSIQAYLYKILNNLIINHNKLAFTKNISIESDLKRNTLKTEDTLETKIDIQLALEKLPNKLKSILVLIKVEGFKYEEAAEICGISVKAIEKRMTKVLRILRDFLT